MRKGGCFLLNGIIIDISFSSNFLLIFQKEEIFDRVNLFVGKICIT